MICQYRTYEKGDNLTENHTYASTARVGRKKEFPNRITLPLSDEMLAGIDASLEGDEIRLDLIRAAIEKELKRREKAKKQQG